jgi:uncharacterized membrane protein
LETSTPPEPSIPLEQSQELSESTSESFIDNADAATGTEEIIELFSSERMVFFSDAVIAISMTLLILPLLDTIQIAKEKDLSGPEYLEENVGIFTTFLLSFFITIEYWRQHEMLFHYVRRYTEAIRIFNPLFLLFIVTLPISTAIATEIAVIGGSVVPIVLYVVNLILINICLTVMYILVRKDPRMWDPNRVPTTSYGLLLLALKFILLFVLLVIVCTVPVPNLLYLLFTFVLVKPAVRYFHRHGDIIRRFGKMMDRYIGH